MPLQSISFMLKDEKDKGAYLDDLDKLKNAWKETGTNNNRHPISYIMEASDDICYLSSDIEDAIKMDIIGISDLEPLVKNIPILNSQYKEEEESVRWDNILNENMSNPRKIVSYILKSAIDHVKKGIDQVDTEGCIVDGFHAFSEAQTNERGSHFNLLYWKNDENKLGDTFKLIKDKFYHGKILKNEDICRSEYLSQKIICSIWDMLRELSECKYDQYDRHPVYQILPQKFQNDFKSYFESRKPENKFARTCSNFISGMTDRYAIQFL